MLSNRNQVSLRQAPWTSTPSLQTLERRLPHLLAGARPQTSPPLSQDTCLTSPVVLCFVVYRKLSLNNPCPPLSMPYLTDSNFKGSTREGAWYFSRGSGGHEMRKRHLSRHGGPQGSPEQLQQLIDKDPWPNHRQISANAVNSFRNSTWNECCPNERSSHDSNRGPISVFGG